MWKGFVETAEVKEGLPEIMLRQCGIWRASHTPLQVGKRLRVAVLVDQDHARLVKRLGVVGINLKLRQKLTPRRVAVGSIIVKRTERLVDAGHSRAQPQDFLILTNGFFRLLLRGVGLG